MIIIRLMGGLGNQLQQYALYTKFISLGREAAIDTSWFDPENQPDKAAPRRLELDLFPEADYRRASETDIRSVTGHSLEDSALGRLSRLSRRMHLVPERHFTETGMYHPEIFDLKDACLEGYWAAEKYYADVLPALREKLTFPLGEADRQGGGAGTGADDDVLRADRQLASEIRALGEAGTCTCSVHIRRGDYLDAVNAGTFGGICTEKYYDAAFAYIRQLHPETVFYIFTDDPDYAAERYGDDASCRFVDINHGGYSRYDMFLMSLCDGHICANSTFSFWGVRLDPDWDPLHRRSGDGLPVSIRPSIHKNSQTFVPEQMHDLWKGWVLIDPEGQVR